LISSVSKVQVGITHEIVTVAFEDTRFCMGPNPCFHVTGFSLGEESFPSFMENPNLPLAL
jgi:hypothetical protein